MIGFGTLHHGSKGNLYVLLLSCLEWAKANRQKIIIDTAQIYDNESDIGNFIDLYPEAIDYFELITKGGINLIPDNPFHTSSELINDLLESYERLRGHISCYMIHRVNTLSNHEEFIKKIFIHKNKFRVFGLSDVSLDILKRIHILCKKYEIPLQFVECNVNAFVRKYVNTGVIDYCRRAGIDIISYNTSLRGLLRVDILDMENYHHLSDDEFQKLLFATMNISEIDQLVGYMDVSVIKDNCKIIIEFIKLAKECNMTPIELSVAYNNYQGFISLLGTSSLDHLKINMNASSIVIEDVIVEKIDNICKDFKGDGNPKVLSYLDIA